MDVGPPICVVGILHIGSCTDSWQHPVGVLPVAIDLMTVSVEASLYVHCASCASLTKSLRAAAGFNLFCVQENTSLALFCLSFLSHVPCVAENGTHGTRGGVFQSVHVSRLSNNFKFKSPISLCDCSPVCLFLKNICTAEITEENACTRYVWPSITHRKHMACIEYTMLWQVYTIFDLTDTVYNNQKLMIPWPTNFHCFCNHFLVFFCFFWVEMTNYVDKK